MLSRKVSLLIIILVVLGALAYSLVDRKSLRSGLTPDLILYNGKIVTVDKDFTIAEALAIYDGKFVAVGRNEEVLELAGDKTRRVDLKGKTVIPGLIDNHTHQILTGLEAPGMDVKVDIARLESIAEIVKAIGEKVKTLKPGEWIETSLMYRGRLKEGRFPNRWDLDPVSPNNPVYIFQSGKNIIVNSYALKLAGITKDTPDPNEPPEGKIVRDPKTGEPTGHLIAGAADRFRKTLWQKMGKKPKMWDFLYYPKEAQVKGLKLVQRYYNSCGVTSVRDMGVSPDEIEAYQELWSRGEMTVRTNLILGIPARYLSLEEIEEYIDKYIGPKTGFGDEMLNLGGIKIVMVNDGYWALSKEKVRAIILAANRNGWQLNIHTATGAVPEALELVLETLEEANKERPIAGRRFSLEHGLPARGKDIYARLKKLGLIVASNQLLSYYASARSAFMGKVMDEIGISKVKLGEGKERAIREWGNAYREWLDNGLVVTGGTDNPAVFYDPEHPLLGIYSLVTQDTLAGVLEPDQKVTREEALRIYTINNAYATFEENKKGSIEPGKLADLAIISDDLLTVPEEKIKDIKVLMTIVGGKIVYKREGADIP